MRRSRACALLAALLLAFTAPAVAVNYVASTTGSWESASTWGGAGTPSLAGDTAYIGSGVVVTASAAHSISALTINGDAVPYGGAQSCGLVLNAGAALAVSGVFTFNGTAKLAVASGAAFTHSGTFRVFGDWEIAGAVTLGSGMAGGSIRVGAATPATTLAVTLLAANSTERAVTFGGAAASAGAVVGTVTCTGEYRGLTRQYGFGAPALVFGAGARFAGVIPSPADGVNMIQPLFDAGSTLASNAVVNVTCFGSLAASVAANPPQWQPVYLESGLKLRADMTAHNGVWKLLGTGVVQVQTFECAGGSNCTIDGSSGATIWNTGFLEHDLGSPNRFNFSGVVVTPGKTLSLYGSPNDAYYSGVLTLGAGASVTFLGLCGLGRELSIVGDPSTGSYLTTQPGNALYLFDAVLPPLPLVLPQGSWVQTQGTCVVGNITVQGTTFSLYVYGTLTVTGAVTLPAIPPTAALSLSAWNNGPSRLNFLGPVTGVLAGQISNGAQYGGHSVSFPATSATVFGALSFATGFSVPYGVALSGNVQLIADVTWRGVDLGAGLTLTSNSSMTLYFGRINTTAVLSVPAGLTVAALALEAPRTFTDPFGLAGVVTVFGAGGAVAFPNGRIAQDGGTGFVFPGDQYASPQFSPFSLSGNFTPNAVVRFYTFQCTGCRIASGTNITHAYTSYTAMSVTLAGWIHLDNGASLNAWSTTFNDRSGGPTSGCNITGPGGSVNFLWGTLHTWRGPATFEGTYNVYQYVHVQWGNFANGNTWYAEVHMPGTLNICGGYVSTGFNPQKNYFGAINFIGGGGLTWDGVLQIGSINVLSGVAGWGPDAYGAWPAILNTTSVTVAPYASIQVQIGSGSGLAFLDGFTLTGGVGSSIAFQRYSVNDVHFNGTVRLWIPQVTFQILAVVNGVLDLSKAVVSDSTSWPCAFAVGDSSTQLIIGALTPYVYNPVYLSSAGGSVTVLGAGGALSCYLQGTFTSTAPASSPAVISVNGAVQNSIALQFTGPWLLQNSYIRNAYVVDLSRNVTVANTVCIAPAAYNFGTLKLTGATLQAGAIGNITGAFIVGPPANTVATITLAPSQVYTLTSAWQSGWSGVLRFTGATSATVGFLSATIPASARIEVNGPQNVVSRGATGFSAGSSLVAPAGTQVLFGGTVTFTDTTALVGGFDVTVNASASFTGVGNAAFPAGGNGPASLTVQRGATVTFVDPCTASVLIPTVTLSPRSQLLCNSPSPVTGAVQLRTYTLTTTVDPNPNALALASVAVLIAPYNGWSNGGWFVLPTASNAVHRAVLTRAASITTTSGVSVRYSAVGAGGGSDGAGARFQVVSAGAPSAGAYLQLIGTSGFDFTGQTNAAEVNVTGVCFSAPNIGSQPSNVVLPAGQQSAQCVFSNYTVPAATATAMSSSAASSSTAAGGGAAASSSTASGGGGAAASSSTGSGGGGGSASTGSGAGGAGTGASTGGNNGNGASSSSGSGGNGAPQCTPACLNGATCSVSGATASCACASGFYGADCGSFGFPSGSSTGGSGSGIPAAAAEHTRLAVYFAGTVPPSQYAAFIDSFESAFASAYSIPRSRVRVVSIDAVMIDQSVGPRLHRVLSRALVVPQTQTAGLRVVVDVAPSADGSGPSSADIAAQFVAHPLSAVAGLNVAGGAGAAQYQCADTTFATDCSSRGGTAGCTGANCNPNGGSDSSKAWYQQLMYQLILGVGGGVVLIALLVVAVCCCCRRRRGKAAATNDSTSNAELGSIGMSLSTTTA